MKNVLFSVILLSTLSILACGGSSSSSTTASSDSTSTGVSTSFPTELVVASPTASETSSSINALLDNDVDVDFALATSADTYAAKKTFLANILNPSSITDCDFNMNFKVQTNNASCYGPILDYTDHPDAGAEPADGQLPGGDLGVWEESSSNSNDACVAEQLDIRMNNITSHVDSAVYAMASMVCVAKVNGKALPGVGSTLDLTSEVAAAFVTNGISATVSTANIARASDDSSGNTVYVATIEGTGTDSDGNALSMAMRLKHVPLDSTNTTYRGKLSIKAAISDGAKFGNCTSSSSTGRTDASSVAYEKTSSTNLAVVLHHGNYCGTSVAPYVSSTDFTVDPTKKFADTTNGWANNFNIAHFNLNPANGSGDFRFAWQAGHQDGNSRILSMYLDDDGATVTGCGYFGFGLDVEEGVDDMSIDRMICNWAGPGNNHTGLQKAQRQCVEKNTAGNFPATSNNFTYAPANNCNSAGAPFAYEYTDGSNSVTTAITNNLIDVSDVNVTIATTPTEVDS